jgi:hypothetical protein
LRAPGSGLAESSVSAGPSLSGERALAGDLGWLAVMAAATLAEFAWWGASWSAGLAPAPRLPVFLAMAYAGLAAAFALRTASRPRSPRSAWASPIVAATLVGAGASMFLPLKFAIPKQVPFWLDAPLAAAERALFGADPWQLLDLHFGWATLPLDRLYGLWLPVQSLVLFSILLERPSRAKSRALIAYSLAWFALGVVAATLLASAGPIFFDRLSGGGDFALLGETLQRRGASMALAESGLMWSAMASDHPGLVAGISAVPSLHVAISLWMFLAARTIAPRAAGLALVYFILIWLASVQLGWHYVGDGLAGAIGMLAIWAVAGAIEGFQDRRRQPG